MLKRPQYLGRFSGFNIRILGSFIAIMFVLIGSAQTTVQKSIPDSSINYVEIDASNCFTLDIETIDGNRILINAKSDGEYQNGLFLKTKEVGNTLQVGVEFQPSFIKHNDKLSAHKVISISLHIQIPHYKSVEVNGRSCNVSISGSYVNVGVGLDNGICNLVNVTENVEVRTQSGDILLKALNGTISAESKYGITTSPNLIPKGHNTYVLKTITGNILLNRSE